jgi:NTE family protein
VWHTAGAMSDPPPGERAGIGLCLSGGGFRGTLFHLGALLRLNELGLLFHRDFRTVASVSGGSITAAQLALALTRVGPPDAGVMTPEVWEREVRAPLRAFTRRDIRTGAFLKRVLPWNVWKTETTGQALACRYEELTARLPLVSLPPRPEFLFLATDMAYGVSWLFSRTRMGDYQVGYMPPPPSLTVGWAVSASACFPPLVGPMRVRLDPSALKGGSAPRDAVREICRRGLGLTDGGNYDNMGLEPVWKDHAVVLVSDAGGLFTNESDRGILWRIPRYVAIQERQSRALRKRWLIASLQQGTLAGTYWGVGTSVSRYLEARPGYSEALAREVISEVRTDLDAFSEAEAAVLENHGYLLADAALTRHLGALLPAEIPPARVPHPDWFPPHRSEDEIRAALHGSATTRLRGRR